MFENHLVSVVLSFPHFNPFLQNCSTKWNQAWQIQIQLYTKEVNPQWVDLTKALERGKLSKSIIKKLKKYFFKEQAKKYYNICCASSLGQVDYYLYKQSPCDLKFNIVYDMENSNLRFILFRTSHWHGDLNQLFKLAQKSTYTTSNGSAIVFFMKQHIAMKFSFIAMDTPGICWVQTC